VEGERERRTGPLDFVLEDEEAIERGEKGRDREREWEGRGLVSLRTPMGNWFGKPSESRRPVLKMGVCEGEELIGSKGRGFFDLGDVVN